MASYNKNNKRIIRCAICPNDFEVVLSRIGRARYCSFDCRNKGISNGLFNNKRCVGRKPWNKGLNGIHLSPKTEWAKSNEKQFDGDINAYNRLHRWVRKNLGRPETCESCLESGLAREKIHWANKSREYKKELTDWIRLCAKCHFDYDKPFRNFNHA